MRLLAFILLWGVHTFAGAVQIGSVHHDPAYFLPKKDKQVEINFTLSADAKTNLNIYDDRDKLVWKTSRKLIKGTYTFSWNGKDASGKPVPAEAYRYTIEATNTQGEKTVYDTSDVTGGNSVQPQNVVWDKQKKVIRYQLTKPSRVIARLGLKNRGPLLKSVLDWVPRKAGFHEEKWDGMDASNVINLGSHPKLEVSMQAFSLSDNTIIVGPKQDKVEFIKNMSWTKDKRTITYKKPKRMFAHAQQPAETRGDLDIQLTLVGDYPKNKDGLPLVKGVISTRLEVKEQDRQRLLDRGFEPIFFLDGFYMHENEMGFLPVTWRWDTKSVTDGEHFITGNIRSYEGNFGTATLKVYVKNK